MFLLPTTVSVLCALCVRVPGGVPFISSLLNSREGWTGGLLFPLFPLYDSYSRFCRYLQEILRDTLLAVRRIQPMTPRSEPMPLACQIFPCLGLHRIAVVPRCHTTYSMYLRILITQ